MKFLRKLRKDSKGATAIEYGLIAVLISIAIIAAVRSVGTTLTGAFETINTELSN